MTRRPGSPFSAAPLELRVFAVFSTVVTVAGFVLTFLGPKRVSEAIIPFTGWSPNLGYLFGLYFVFALIFSRREALRLGVVGPLLVQIVFGLVDLSRSGRENYGNPYLTVSPWRPVWTMAVPAIWVLVLYSPRMRKFCLPAKQD